jgi:TRAP-type C4-dicarboxylate transport system permease small subunit
MASRSHSDGPFDRAVSCVAILATASLIVAIVMVAADVVVRKMMARAMIGTVDVTELALVISAFLTIPLTFLRRSHVAVEIVTEALPRRGRILLDAIGAIAGGVLFLVIGLVALRPARMSVAAGDVSQDLAIPLVYYWVPMIGGSLLASVAAFLVAWRLMAELAEGRR